MSSLRRHALVFLRKLSAKSCFCIFSVLLLNCFFSACTATNYVNRHSDVSKSRDVKIIDSSIERDSVAIKVVYRQIRDTIYRDSIAIRYRFLNKTDTTFVMITDTIWMPGPEKIVESPISKVDAFFIKLGKVATMVIVFVIIFLIIKIKS